MNPSLRLLILFLAAAAVALAGACASNGVGSGGSTTVVRTGGVERGKASWYGEKFQGRTTACGEKFNQRRLTAAHPSLPCGAIVRITSLSTGKQVTVRINDHFPGTRGRIIDLSEAAFATVASKSLGVIDVTVEVLSLPKK